jgi:hypothetical protein
MAVPLVFIPEESIFKSVKTTWITGHVARRPGSLVGIPLRSIPRMAGFVNLTAGA